MRMPFHERPAARVPPLESAASGDARVDPSVWTLQNGGGVELVFETYVEVPEPAATACAAVALVAAGALARRLVTSPTSCPAPALRRRLPRSPRAACRGRGARAAGRATAG